MTESKVPVFFYGSFMNKEVLARGGFTPERIEVSRLWGFDIRIETMATLVRSDRQCVFGIVCDLTHAELKRLYQKDPLTAYLPEPVQIEIIPGRFLPALCYIAPEDPPAPPSSDYLDWIIGPARQYGFPQWYIDRLESFRKKT